LRAQEDQADRAASKFLTATNQSAKGMAETFKRLADQTLYQTQYMSPYTQLASAASERVPRSREWRVSSYWDTCTASDRGSGRRAA